jgi:hypothetical protein
MLAIARRLAILEPTGSSAEAGKANDSQNGEEDVEWLHFEVWKNAEEESMQREDGWLSKTVWLIPKECWSDGSQTMKMRDCW